MTTQDDGREKPGIEDGDDAARRSEDETHDTGAPPYATEQRLNEEQLKRHQDSKGKQQTSEEDQH